ncbi:unnamed protein product [Oreochromis niloticus]|nr:unnamed protein product [Mustela putorius furo]
MASRKRKTRLPVKRAGLRSQQHELPEEKTAEELAWDTVPASSSSAEEEDVSGRFGPAVPTASTTARDPNGELIAMMRDFLVGQQRREEVFLAELRGLRTGQESPAQAPAGASTTAATATPSTETASSPRMVLPTPARQRGYQGSPEEVPSLPPGESPTETYYRLKGLYRRWIRPEQHTKEETGEAIILEQLIRVLPGGVRTLVREHEPADGLTAAKLVSQYFNARKGAPPARSSGTPQRPPLPSLGLLKRESNPEPPENPRASNLRAAGKDFLCYYFQQPGHKASVCPIQKAKVTGACYAPRLEMEPTRVQPVDVQRYKKVKGPLDLLRKGWESPASASNDKGVVQFVLEMRERLGRYHEEAEVDLRDAQRSQKTWYDQQARQREFQPGQKVLLLLPSANSKLLAKWQGPYTVLRRMGPVTYEIYHPEKKKPKQTYHVNLLKEWEERAHQAPAEALIAREVPREEETEPEQGSDPMSPVLTHLTPQQAAQLLQILRETPSLCSAE